MEEVVIDLDALSVADLDETLSSSTARLAPWQIRLAKEGMAQQLGEGVRVADVAARLDLSVTHFSKAFRNSVGIAPYRWFQNARLAYALRLVTETRASMAEIATACGYSGQSNFIKAFQRVVGTTPARWRRMRHEQGCGVAAVIGAKASPI